MSACGCDTSGLKPVDEGGVDRVLDAPQPGRIPEELPYWVRFRIDGAVLLYSLLIAVGTGMVVDAIEDLVRSAGRASLQ